MIRTPPGWGADVLTHAYQSITATRRGPRADTPSTVNVRHIELADLRWALTRGMEDFGASRTDVIFLCVVYPLMGLLLARLASGYDMLPLIFPVGVRLRTGRPVSCGRAERNEPPERDGSASRMGRRIRRIPLAGDRRHRSTWSDPIDDVPVLAGLVERGLQPDFGASAAGIFGQFRPTTSSLPMLVGRWRVVGVGAGFLLAVTALTISVVSFPMLLDQGVPLETAIRTSARVVARNPRVMAAWGLIIAASLVIGSIPALLGLIFVMPVLGHATWHLYRRVVSM